MDNEQSKFEGYAIVDVLGHQRYVGYVRTESYGAAVLFRVDVPALPEREYALESPQYVDGIWAEVGTRVQRAASPGYTKLIGAGSIYTITPCSEEAALKGVETTQRPPLKLVELVFPGYVPTQQPLLEPTREEVLDALGVEETPF